MGAHREASVGSRVGIPAAVLVALVSAGLALVSGGLLPGRHHDAPAPSASGHHARVDPARAAPGLTSRSGDPARRTAPFDKAAHSVTDPSSIWVVVNKTHPIAPDFRPGLAIVRGYQIAAVAAGPLGDLLDAGDRAGLGFKIASAFRSYDYQFHVHDSLVASEGSRAADRISARPGYSEHQTGLAADLITPGDPRCDFEQCFARTAAGTWLAAHAWEYGFLVRYTKGNEAVTGYSPEPWHLRYVGRPLAAAMHADGATTLEEFLGVPGGDYPR